MFRLFFAALFTLLSTSPLFAASAINSTLTAITPGYAGNLTETQIGETVTYQTVITIPEDVYTQVTLVELLDNGLAITDVVSIVASSGDLTTNVGTFGDVLTNAVIASSGAGTHQLDRQLTLDFGTLSNVDTGGSSDETLTITYRARLLNWSGNSRGNSLGNFATWSWDDPVNIGQRLSLTDSATNISATEPTLTITKSLSTTSGDAGDTVTVTLDIAHSVSSDADAHDITLEDILPTGFTYAGSPATAGVAPTTGPSHGGGTVTASWNTLAQGNTAQISFAVTLDSTVNPEQTIQNTASVEWESLLTADEGALSNTPNNTLGVERTGDTGDTGGSGNDYNGSHNDSLSIPDGSISLSIDSVTPNGASPDISTGDTVSLRNTVTLPEGTTGNLVVVKNLPAGADFQSAVLDTTGFTGSAVISSASVTGGSVASGQEVTISFNASTTVTGNNNSADNAFDIVVEADITDVVQNNGLSAKQTKTSTATMTYTDSTGPYQDTVSIDFAEPELSVTMVMTPDTGLSAGDTVTVTLEITNIGTAPAYDINVTDVLNDGGAELLFDTSSAQEVQTSGGFTYGFVDPTVTWDANASTALAVGATEYFKFTAVVRADVVTGSSFDNVLSITGDSQDGVVANERTTSDTGSDTVSTDVGSLGSRQVATSESWTTGTDAAIGEILTLELAFRLPEGLTREDGIIITDTLPAGHSYITGSGLIRTDADTGMSGSVYGAIPTSNTTYNPTVNSQTLEWDLGDITNSDNDGGIEQVILTYDVLVGNSANNNRTDSKSNSGSLNYLNKDGAGQSLTDSVSWTIVEPNLTLTKSASPTTVAGGSTATFTVVLTNVAGTNVTRAWEPTITDDLDLLTTRFQNPSVTSATHSYQGDITACADFAGNVLTVDPSGCLAAVNNHLPAGDTITVVYTADIDPAVGFEEDVDNRAIGLASSLPGDYGTGSNTPGTPSDINGERTGSGGGSAGVANDLRVSDDAQVTAGKPSITKTAGSNSLPIGDTTLITLVVNVPVGTTGTFVITDDLPSGLRYTGTAISITSPAMNFAASSSPSTTPGAGTDPLVFDFGTITNSDAAAQSITIVYEVAAENILANQRGTNLTNTATLTYLFASQPFPSDTATITVQEPDLAISQSITAGATGSGPGDTIGYQLVLTNSGTSTAFGVDLRDVMPAELLGAPDGTGSSGTFFQNISVDNDSGAVVKTGGGLALVIGDAQQTTTTNPGDTLTWPKFDLPAGATLTLNYDAIAHNSAVIGTTLTNNATATYTSLTGDQGRDSTDSIDDGDGNLNNYGASDSVSFSLEQSLAIQTTLNSRHSSNSFTIGDQIGFDLRVDLSEGVIGNIAITDSLPAGLSQVGSARIIAGPHISYTGAPALDGLSWAMGDVTNTADADNTNDYLIIEVETRVDDVPTNVAGTTLTNSASATSDIGSAGPDPMAVNIVEPRLAVTLDVSDTTPSLGDKVTFSVTVKHEGSGASAHNVAVSSLIPAGLTYVDGSHSGLGSVYSSNPSRPTFGLGSITLAEGSKSFTFDARVEADASVGEIMNNTISVAYDGRPGSSTVQRRYRSTDTNEITPHRDAGIDATQVVSIIYGGASGGADAGDTLMYTITLTNKGEPVSGVTYTNPIPARTYYLGASLTSNKGIPNDANPNPLSVAIGEMSTDEIVTISFRVAIEAGVASGTVISSQGQVDSAQTVPEFTDADGFDANGDQPTETTIGGTGSLPADMYTQKLVQRAVDADASSTTSPGDTMRYLLLVKNSGGVELTHITLFDRIPAGLSYVNGTASVTGAGNRVGVSGSNLSVTIPSLAAGSSETVQFDVTIDAMGGSVGSFSNQTTITSDQIETALSDGIGFQQDGNQPTSFSAVNGVGGTPVMDLESRVALMVDVDGDGLADPGDKLLYLIELTNVGSADASNLRLSNLIATNTTIVPGSVIFSQGIIVADDPISINLGGLAAAASVSVQYAVTVDVDTPNDFVISQQAVVSADTGITALSDNNSLDSDGQQPNLTPVHTHDDSEPDMGCHPDDVYINRPYIRGQTENSGNILDAPHICPEGHLTGGTITGQVKNEGIIEGVQIRGHVENSGTLIDAHFGTGSETIGGDLEGSVIGNPDSPAHIKAARVKSDSQLMHIVIDPETLVEPNVALGEGTRFQSNENIPASIELTDALPKVTISESLGGPQQLPNLNEDVLLGEQVSLLGAMRGLPDYESTAITLVQNPNSGNLEVEVDTHTFVVHPLSVRQAAADKLSGTDITAIGDIEITTENGRQIIFRSALEQPSAFIDALKALGLNVQGVEGDTVYITSDTQNRNITGEPIYSVRPYHRTEAVSQEAELGLFSTSHPILNGLEQITLVYEKEGERRAQLLTPTALDRMALKHYMENDLEFTDVQLELNGIIAFNYSETRVQVLMDYRAVVGAPPVDGKMTVISAGDLNRDGLGDYEVIYANGRRQYLYLYP